MREQKFFWRNHTPYKSLEKRAACWQRWYKNKASGFYTYLWLREDGTPYYVGKGTGKRAWRKGRPPESRVIIQEFLSEMEAHIAEMFLIAYFGRKNNASGILRNLTEGGEGVAGLRMSEESKLKMREAKLGTKRFFSEEHRKHLSTANKGKKPHPNTIAALTGRKPTVQMITKLREANLGKRYSEETKAKHAAAWMGDLNPKRKNMDIIQQLTRDEGMKLLPYKDTRGFTTIGVGHNCDANPLPFDISQGITKEQAISILGVDVERISRQLQLNLPWVVSLDDARHGVLQNMSFNLGVGGLMEFHHDLADTQAGNYVKAAADMQASAWYTEVGDRAKRLVQQMLTGQWV